MALIQSIIPTNKYDLKCPYSMVPKWIIIHNTANDASARNEISYMGSNNYEVSFHIAIDDKEAIQGIPFNRNSWNASDGNGEGNRNGISIEICYSKSGGERFINAEKRASVEVAALLKEFGWGLDRVRTHQSFARDNKKCPHRTIDMGWQRFLNMIQVELNKLNNPQQSSDLYRVRLSWGEPGSQKGAYSNMNNAIAECKKHSGYSVYNSSGVVVYTNSATPIPTPPPVQPSKAKVDIFYKFDNLPWVKNLQDNAGIRGVAAKNLYAYPSNGEVLYRVSRVNGDYYSWVKNYKSNTGNYDYAGNGVAIDRVQMKLINLNGYSIRYRVRLSDGTLLPWVVNDSDYAGIRGRAISNIEIEIV